MNQNLIIEWSELLSNKLNRHASEIAEFGLTVRDFSLGSVEITFEDESYCKFNRAFVVENSDKHQVAVFTEHCGYHVFSNLGVTVFECYGSNKTAIVQSDW